MSKRTFYLPLPLKIYKHEKLEERKMTEEMKALAERINFCAHTLKVFGAGELIVDTTRPNFRYEVNSMGKVRTYRTIEELESFAEHLIDNRKRPSYNTRYARSRRMASYVA